MKNLKIREALALNKQIRRKPMYQYELADLLGIDEGTLCRKLRKELSEEEQTRIIELIHNSIVMEGNINA